MTCKWVGDTSYAVNKNLITAHVMLTNQCPFSCSYCVAGCNKHTDNATSYFDNISYAQSFIMKLWNIFRDKDLSICLTGGEPTFCNTMPNITKLLTQLPNVIMVQIISNMYRSITWWEDFINLIQNRIVLLVIASFHSEMNMHNYDDFFKKVNLLRMNGINCASKLIITDSNLEFMLSEFKEYMVSHPLSFPMDKTSIGIDFHSNQKPILNQASDTLKQLMKSIGYCTNRNTILKKDPMLNLTYNESFYFTMISKVNNEYTVIPFTTFDRQLNLDYLSFDKPEYCDGGNRMIMVNPQGLAYGGATNECPLLIAPVIDFNDSFATVSKIKPAPMVCELTHCPHECSAMIPKYDMDFFD